MNQEDETRVRPKSLNIHLVCNDSVALWSVGFYSTSTFQM